ncbi:MAG: YybH family protein [Gemmatimonadales bacterium]
MIEFPRFAALLLAGCAASVACRPGDGGGAAEGGPPARTISEGDKARIRGADSAFAASANAGNVDGIAAVYTGDATLLAPNLPPQKGRDAIRGFWGGFLQAYTVRFELVSDTIEGRGDLAYNQGRYRFRAVPKARNVPGVADEGKFLAILKKQPDGDWKLVLDMYSSNLAPQH